MTKTNATKRVSHKKGHLGMKGLGIILVVLSLVIIGLIIWIIVVKTNENPNKYIEEYEWAMENSMSIDGPSGGSEYPPRNPPDLASTTYSEAAALIDSQAPNAYADAMQLFDKAAASASAQDEIFYIESIRINLLLDYGYYSESIPYIDKISDGASGPNEQYTIYAFYEEAYKGLGDTEASKQYDILRREASVKINQELYDTQE